MLRRVEYGDYDLIITFFTLIYGKIATIAKSAKKSTKRFAGKLEPFSLLNIVYAAGRSKGLPVLMEAELKEPFAGIRTDIKKTAYASYWAELVYGWIEEHTPQKELFTLLHFVLTELDGGRLNADQLSVLFQLRFMTVAGMGPRLTECRLCRLPVDQMGSDWVGFDLTKGGLVCSRCKGETSGALALSKGTVKQLLWMSSGTLTTSSRVRFSTVALQEAIDFLEAFVPYHLGKMPRSLRFVQQIRVPLKRPQPARTSGDNGREHS